jgi:hypothetical protein
MLIAALAAFPMPGAAAEPPVPAPMPTFDLHSDSVLDAIHSAAASQYGGDYAERLEAPSPKPGRAPPIVWRQPEGAPVVATPDKFDHFDCDASDCVARDRQHKVIYTVPLELTNEKARLACQSRDALPGAAQGYERCTTNAVAAQTLADHSDEPSPGQKLLGDVVLGLLEGLFR